MVTHQVECFIQQVIVPQSGAASEVVYEPSAILIPTKPMSSVSHAKGKQAKWKHALVLFFFL
jgi:hypothetical protein